MRIQFVDTDASGRIHYTSTFRHFETAEMEFMRHLGCHYNHMEKGGVAYPRVRVECDYLAALTYDDEVEVGVSVERVGEKSFTLAFDVQHLGRTAARGKIVIAAMDRATGKSCALPRDLVEKLEGAQACVS